MADAPKLLGTDTLRQAYPKINSAIDNANEALGTANTAKITADTAKSTAENADSKAVSVQSQFNQVVIDGDSSVEAAQARVNVDGTVSYTTLKERLDTEYNLKVDKDTVGDLSQLITDDKSSIVNAVNEIRFKKGIEVLESDPTDLYEGRIWIVSNPNLAEIVDTDTLNLPYAHGHALSNAATPYRKASTVYKPSNTINLTKVEMKFSTRSSTLHNTGNPITVKICPDISGVPDESNPIATATITGCPSTPDTIFTKTVTFATNANNFGDAIILNANTRYHFVLSTSGTGLTYYSVSATTGASSTDELASEYYLDNSTPFWKGIDETINPHIRTYKAE